MSDDTKEKPAKTSFDTKALIARIEALETRVASLEKRVAPQALTSSEVRDLLAANPYTHFRVLEPFRVSGLTLHKGHVFRADTLSGLPAYVSAHGLQLAESQP